MYRQYLFAVLLAVGVAIAAPSNPLDNIHGSNILTDKPVSLAAGKKGSVVVFLSSSCPCSNSHVEILKKLAAAHPDVSFVGIHSNTDEKQPVAKAYFEKANFPFPVIQDNGAKIADAFRAFKTPHSFLISNDGKIVYRGGVTNSHNGPTADKQYLANALQDLEAQREIREPVGRTLGCVIAR